MVQLVIMPERLEERLIDAARQRYPYEACGLIYGTLTDSAIRADNFDLVRNVAVYPERAFVFDPEQWIRLYFEAQKNQRAIVGFFHSHPQGSSAPSLQDILQSFPWGTYWIVGSASAQGEISVYRIESDRRWIRLPVERLP
ncbi:M67 family peptidase [Cohnella endophytica]|uniref:M67 family peptidase n=1 Tax=Cohnella endophytica TaxID=2419778 RepID=A0A494XUR4_9BACL|nr:M67 family metallopeptidase [Cohnella endophytica]RKP54310.1 M67 family peptidase [Cohnella endophytica]